jgi:4-hydroxybenzoate polyprenyltransferase
MNRLVELMRLVRWRDWFFDKTLSLFFVAFYVALVDRLFSPLYLGHLAILLIFAILSAAYGFLVNDLGDREIDRQQGKVNAFHRLDPARAPLLLGGLLLAATLVCFPFWRQVGFLLLWGLWILVTTAYSLPPLRFKERGFWGIIAPGVAQFVLPPLLFFAAFGHLTTWDAGLLVAYLGTKGLSIALGQQKQDLDGDLYTRTTTFAVRTGYKRVARAYAAALFAEQVLLAMVLILMLFQIPPLEWPGLIGRLPSILPLVLGHAVLAFLAVRQMRMRGHITDPYFDPNKDIFNILYAIFPCGLVPFYMALLMSLRYPGNLVILLLLVLWVGPSPRRLLWPLRALWASLGFQSSQRSAENNLNRTC